MAAEAKEVGRGLQEHILEYKQACDPLYTMALLIDLMRKSQADLSEEDWRQLAGCHNLLAAVLRNE
jgi:hypothetical protein